MARKRQGSGGDVAQNVAAGGAETVVGNVPTPVDGEDTAQASSDPNQHMPDYTRPGPKAADASPQAATALPARQNFAGKYTALARLNLKDGTQIVMPGTEVILTDEEARHFLASKVVRLFTPTKARATKANELPTGHDFAGQYITCVGLKLDDGTRVPPETSVHLDDQTARHFLAQQAIRSATGLSL